MMDKKEGDSSVKEYVDTTLRTSHYKQCAETCELVQEIYDHMKKEPTLGNRVLINHQRIVRLEEHLDRVVALIERLVSTQGEIVDKVTEPPDEEVDDGMTDIEADSDALASAGFGTDEDYGGTDESL